ncbi:MAG: NAD-dependent epimerase/dehydratase family protein [Candidatus Coatesbacteria bacterium]
MKVLVTGVAGFIGSTLAERLLDAGHEVVGIDCFTPYYSRALKEANMSGFIESPRFQFHEADLRSAEIAPLLNGIEVVVHLAGQPGVRGSFGPDFALYAEHNILATHRLLEASRMVRLFVFASSASVYGSVPVPMREDGPVRPVSPYGVTKLAAEQLCLQYAAQGLVPAMAFRFFSVYGPRQRPDMAFPRLIRTVLDRDEFTILGTGDQQRDFTYVGDVVDALVAALAKGKGGLLLNLGGGHKVSLNHTIAIVERLAGLKAKIARLPAAAGDMEVTEADATRLRAELGFAPKTSIEDGLANEVEWVRANLKLLRS